MSSFAEQFGWTNSWHDINTSSDEYPLSELSETRDGMPHRIDLIIDGGLFGLELTTVVCFAEDAPELIQLGKGDVTLFGWSY